MQAPQYQPQGYLYIYPTAQGQQYRQKKDLSLNTECPYDIKVDTRMRTVISVMMVCTLEVVEDTWVVGVVADIEDISCAQGYLCLEVCECFEPWDQGVFLGIGHHLRDKFDIKIAVAHVCKHGLFNILS
jgi:hypothetical protein